MAASILKRCCFSPLAPRRSFASATQLDYYFEDEDQADQQQQHYQNLTEAVVDLAGWVPRRGIQWCLIGDRSARKHLYAEKLSKLLDVPRISMDSLVRQDLNPHSALYKQIARAVNGGKLVEDEVIFALLSKRLEEGYYRAAIFSLASKKREIKYSSDQWTCRGSRKRLIIVEVNKRLP